MVKKSGIKKITVKTKKRKILKKAGMIPASPKKTVSKEKQDRKAASKIRETKTQGKKQKTEVTKKEKTARKQKKVAVRPEQAAKKARPKKTIKKTPVIAPPGASKKIKAPQKTEKRPKTTKVKTTAKKSKEKKSKEIKKTAKKITEQPPEKITTGKAGKPKASKPRKTPSKKRDISRAKKKEPVTIKASEKIEQGKEAKRTPEKKKQKTKKVTEIDQTKKTRVLSKAKEVKAIPESSRGIETDVTKAAHPLTTVPVPPAQMETLPAEYGENSIILMPVNPYRLFAFWEVRKEILSIFRGNLNLRVYDVTGIDFDTTDAHSYIDSAVAERIGKMYLDVSPAKEYVADIGIVYNGIFIGIARSPRVSTPGAGVAGEEEFLPEVLEVGFRIGY